MKNNRPNPITCAGHADLIQTKENEWWAVFLACRPINNQFENLGRETFIMPVKWSEDGFPYMTQGEDLIPMILRREGITRDTLVTFGNFSYTENFENPSLDNTWMTLRTPATDLYSLSETPGYLTLKCGEFKVSEKETPAFICRRIQHHKFICSSRMLFNPEQQEAAGMLLFKDENHSYFFSVCKKGDDKYIALTQIGPKGKTMLKSQVISPDNMDICMKVISSGEYYDFYYSLNNGEDWEMLCNHIDASFLSTANAGGFTGTTIGLYASKEE